ncbi:FAD-dependent oxidoreductase [Chloroflexota bacterium]
MELKHSIPGNWDRDTDVIVVGYGAAGAATAITAYDEGAEVLILEKAPEGEEGGNSRVAVGGWFTPTPVSRAISYFNALCGAYSVPEEMVKVWAEEMGENKDWVISLGGNPVKSRTGLAGAEFPELPGADCVHSYRQNGERGNEQLFKLLKTSVDKRGIKVLYATPGKELIENCPTKEILGVRTEREGNQFNIKAKRAVVLTCGGFENNQEMVRDFLTNLPYCYPWGTPYNTGDGIKMAMAAGADLWHMNNIAGPWYALKVTEFPSVFMIRALYYDKELPGGMILVGADGKRFINEKHKIAHGKVQVAGRWIQAPSPCPMFMVFDHTLFSAGPLYNKNDSEGWNAILKVYDWSDDNSAEMARGWINKADTIEELAMRIKLNPAVLEDTANKWNKCCAVGKDTDFGRTVMLSPIGAKPFYAIEVSPAFINTQGGPRRNGKGQILRPDGSPIRRLYSAGELGSIHSFLYQAAGNLGECLAFGRISGRNAATEKPWD